MSHITPPAVAKSTIIAEAVTALFVPGDRPERFGKAAAAGADVVIIDLEDAVAPEAKSRALSATFEALTSSAGGGIEALVRVNAIGSARHNYEIEALLTLTAGSGHGLLGIMVPKAEDPKDLSLLAEVLPEGLTLVPLIESATGLVNSLSLAQTPKVSRLAFGAIDFALDTGSSSEEVLDYARSQLVVNSKAAGIFPPLDSPATDIAQTTRVSDSAARARKFGFGGKLCIHPAQVTAVRTAFSPTPQQIEWAQSVVGADDGAAQVDGQMIDRPVREQARKILELAEKTKEAGP